FSHQPMVYLMFILVFFVQYVLFHTPWGLRLRAVGEHPRAADTMGIDVNRTRYINVVLGGVLAGLGGAFLVLESVGRFQKQMTAGRGFIALAVMIFGRWTPINILGAALLFGFADALGVRLQFGDLNHLYVLMVFIGLAFLIVGLIQGLKGILMSKKRFQVFENALMFLILGGGIIMFVNFVPLPKVVIPVEFLGLLPYVLTILVLSGFVRKAIAPAAIGKPYEKE
ncbi:MAG: hypothetical protein WHV66_06310, partial [Anaerolineales bacterium]